MSTKLFINQSLITELPSINEDNDAVMILETDDEQVLVINKDGSLTQVPSEYSGEGSHQVVAPDLNVSPDVGSDESTDPSFIAAIMGNLIGADLENASNYLAGVIGAYSVTGVKATTYPAGAVQAIIMDGVTDVDGAVVAVIDGDSSVTKANAAFKAMMNNSNAGSGFDFGLDLTAPAHDGYNELAILKADLRLSKEVCIMSKAGVPSTDGTGFADTGSLCVDRSAGDIYINVGDKTTPDWKKITHA